MKESIVIDTNILVSALRSKQGASYKLLSFIGTDHFKTVISVPLILEYEDVLSREYIPLDKEAITSVLDYFCKVSEHRKVHYLWRPLLKDPKDDHILELAVEAQCTAIVTYNKRDFEGASQFCLVVETPLEFLKRLEIL